MAAERPAAPKVAGIVGHSGMGKTTLLERLVPELRRRGLAVSLVKHSHKPIEIDRPGKDSFRLREAGCREVLLVGRDRWALMHELRGDPEPPLEYLLGRLQRCDLVLVEGFKAGDFPKLEVWRSALGKPPLAADRDDIVAVACEPLDDTPWRRRPITTLALTDTAGIADTLLDAAGVSGPRR